MADAVEPIAVIGMACRLPGAPDLERFWQNLAAGAETVSFFDDGDLAAAGVDPAERADPDYVPAAPMLPDANRFDAGLFGMTAAEARACDPQFRTFLEVCHAAAEHAGYDPFALPDTVGVFGATGPNSYLHHILRTRPDLAENSPGMALYTLNSPDYLATLTSYKLDLRGPSMTVLTACSSSLVAVHLAAQALRAGECDAALAGGVNLELPLGHGHRWTPGGVLTRDGHCRPFDAAASGTIFGSGAGAVLLKRLDAALAAGDRVLAVIRGSAVNNDGADKVSFSAPSVSGQAAAIAEAMLLAGAAPADLDYVEAHATGTDLGDPIEVAALAEAYRALSDTAPVPGRTALGSVKSNIGHMNTAAGIAGLIKTVLMLDRETIVPSVNLTEPNPRLELHRTPFELATRSRRWPRRTGRPRLAAVSSLGIGGTNAHVVLGEGPSAALLPAREAPRLVVWSARDEEGVAELGGRLAAHFGARGESGFADAVGTLQRGRTAHRSRAAVVASSAGEAAKRIGDGGKNVVTGRVRPGVRRAFLFPGQGSHRIRMAAGLYGTSRPFSVAMDECLEQFELCGLDLAPAWLDADRAERTETVQPLLFAVGYALAETWRAWGVVPDAVLGHSVGELVAATIAGVFELPEAARVVAARAAAMAEFPNAGGMLAAAADVGEVRRLLLAARAELPELAIAAVNGSGQTVVSGPHEALSEFAAALTEHRVASRLMPVEQAFHHPGWAAASARFGEVFRTVAPKPPRIPWYSGLTGARVEENQAADPDFWTRQLTEPVLFAPALTELVATGEWTVVESGPGRALTSVVRRLPATREGRIRAVPALGSGDGEESLLHALAELWADGADLDWEAGGQPQALTRQPLPGYPYRRDRYWIDADDFADATSTANSARSAGTMSTADTAASASLTATANPVLSAGSTTTADMAASGSPTTTVNPALSAGPMSTADPAASAGPMSTASSAAAARAVAPAASPGSAVAATEQTDQPTPPASAEEPSPLSTVEWIPAPPTPVAVPGTGGTALLLLPADAERALTVVLAAERAGYRTIRITPGAEPGESASGFRVRPSEPDDLAAVSAALAERGVYPDLFLHAASYAEPGAAASTKLLAEHLDAAFFTLLALARQALTRPAGRPAPRLTVLTSGAADVSGSDPLVPARAAALALIRTLAAEAPDLTAAVVDAGARTGIAEIAAELSRPAPDEVVALRGRRRWLPVERPAAVPAPVREVLRERGVYLITGGFGGLGLALARHLAATGLRPRLVLTGRRDPRDPGADPADPYVVRARAALAELAELGAETLVAAGDAAEPGALAAAFDAAQDRFGPVNGVFHLAGVAGGRMIAFRDPADAAAVLAPKTLGTLLLAEAASGRTPLDFAVLFGSRAGEDGLVGSADYAAANAFLAAAAETVPFPAARVLTVGWPVWSGAGMADAAGADLGGLAGLVAQLAEGRNESGPEPEREREREPDFAWEADFGAATHWILDEHRVNRVPLLPGSGYVDLVVTRYTEHLAGPGQNVELTDVVFRAPFSDQRSRRLRLEFRATETGHDFTIASRPADSDASWTHHVSGHATARPAEPRTVDLQALRRRMADAGSAPPEKLPTDSAFTMGPRWRNVAEVWHSADGTERLLRLALMPALVGDLPAHRLHPALLDTGTAGVRSTAEGAFVPFLYRRLVAHADLPSELYSHVRRHASDSDTAVGDVDLIAPDGTVLAAIEGFTMRRVAFEPGWDRDQDPQPAEQPKTRPERGVEGLSPETGMRLLMALLAADTPRSVLVRPYVDGQPVPIAGASQTFEAVAPPVVTTVVKPPEVTVATSAPATTLADLWQHAIGAPPADDAEDFFDVGGNSLSAVELIGRIRAVYGLELSIGLLLDVRTFGGLRAIVESGGGR